MSVAGTRAPRAPRVAVVTVTALAMLALAACAPEPEPTAASTPTPTSTSTSSVEPSPTETTAASGDIALPADCTSIYSAEMLTTLETTVPPLGDPGVTMGSSQIVEALELLESGIPTLRCTWGQPSGFGLATNVSLVEQDQAQELVAALQGVGFACDPVSEGTLCRLDRSMIDEEDDLVELGEAHFFRGNGWITTAWIRAAVAGYTEDIAATLWP